MMKVWFEGARLLFENMSYDLNSRKYFSMHEVNVGGEIKRIKHHEDNVFIEASHKNMVALNISIPDKMKIVHEDSDKMPTMIKKQLELFLKGESDLEIEKVNELTWEQFKEQMDYFLNLLKQEGISDDTKEEINNGMKNLIREWCNPKYIIKNDSAPAQ